MSENIIGASQAAIDSYETEAIAIFTRINQRMQQLVARAFGLTYEGPDAETVFNPGLSRLATESMTSMNEAMRGFATAVSTVTSNISRSLGAGEVHFVFTPPALELPPPPGVAADDFRIDTAAFDAFLGTELPEAQAAIVGLLADNQQAFNAIPRATADAPGWSGESRDYAQNTVVPAQTEQLTSILQQVVQQVTDFMTSAKNGTLAADRAGVGSGGGARIGGR